MSFVNAIRVSRGPLVSLGAIGTYWGAFAGMVPVIKAQAGASDLQFGSGLIFAALGGMLAMYVAPKVSHVLGRFLLPSLGIVMAFMMQLPIFAHSVMTLYPVMFILGASMSSLDINANMRLSQLEERHGMHLMNLNHAMFSLCFGVSAYGVAKMRQAGFDVAQVLPLVGLIVLVFSALSWEKEWRAFEVIEGQEAAPSSLPWFFITMVGVMLFVSFLGENATEAWSALFIERELGGAVGEGSYGPATLGIVMFLVRMAGQFLTEKLGEERVVFWSGVFGVIGSLVMASAQTQFVALLGIKISAIGMAVIVPTANSLLGKVVHREQRAIAISRAWIIGFTGFFVGPSLIGFISHVWGLRVAFFVVAILIAAILPAVIAVKRRRAAGV